MTETQIQSFLLTAEVGSISRAAELLYVAPASVSKQIAQLLNTDDSQVRKDINYLDNSGKSRVGYVVKELKLAI